MALQAEWIITCAQLRECIQNVTLVDVREPDEYAVSRIEGGKLIPLGDIQQRAPHELKKDDDIVLYCAHGMRSLQAVMALKMLGFKKLRSLEGGIAAWEQNPV